VPTGLGALPALALLPGLALLPALALPAGAVPPDGLLAVTLVPEQAAATSAAAARAVPPAIGLPRRRMPCLWRRAAPGALVNSDPVKPAAPRNPSVSQGVLA
jgi:hypothetical protein